MDPIEDRDIEKLLGMLKNPKVIKYIAKHLWDL